MSLQAIDDEEARRAVLHLNALEEKDDKTERDRKTFGRTPDGIGKGIGIRSARELLLAPAMIPACWLRLEKLMHSA